MKRLFLLSLTFFLAACAAPDDVNLTPQDQQIVQTADHLKQMGDAASAVTLLNKAQSNEPDNPAIGKRLGYALIADGQPQKAAQVFDHMIELHPDNATAYNGKGVALDRIGDHLAAQRLYKQALKLSPDSMSIKNNMAMSMILNNQIGEAIVLLEELNRQPGATQTVRQNLALAYGIKGDKEQAMALNLQDLSPAEAQENMHFYEQYAKDHKKMKSSGKASKIAADTPSSINDMPDVVTSDSAGPATLNDLLASAATPPPAMSIPTILPPIIAPAPKALPALAPKADSPAPPIPVAIAQKKPDEPLPNLAPKAGTPAPKKETVTAITTGKNAGIKVQLGAFHVEKDAKDAWSAMQQKHADLLAKAEPVIVKADLGAKGVYYRLRIGGFTDVAEANTLCSKLSAAGQPCIVPTYK